MRLTKDECRFISSMLSEHIADIFYDNEIDGKIANELIVQFDKIAKDHRRTGRHSMDDFNDLRTRLFKALNRKDNDSTK